MNEYTLKKISDNEWQLLRADRLLATLTRADAWRVMLGQVDPETLASNGNETAVKPDETLTKHGII